jgi:hypothetical protein
MGHEHANVTNHLSNEDCSRHCSTSPRVDAMQDDVLHFLT